MHKLAPSIMDELFDEWLSLVGDYDVSPRNYSNRETLACKGFVRDFSMGFLLLNKVRIYGNGPWVFSFRLSSERAASESAKGSFKC
jgi:hypothetical protein